MFTLQQIKDAHSKVKSGTDFPKFIQDLIQLGVTHYKTHVSDGHTLYEGANNYKTQSDPRYATLTISDNSNPEQFIKGLKEHQQGKSNYMQFCELSAEHGVNHWIVDTTKMTCTYYDTAGQIVLEEKIPS